jgi:hypothetical protein
MAQYPADFGDDYKGRFVRLRFNCGGKPVWNAGRIGDCVHKPDLGQHVHWVWYWKDENNTGVPKLEPGPRPWALEQGTYNAQSCSTTGQLACSRRRGLNLSLVYFGNRTLLYVFMVYIGVVCVAFISSNTAVLNDVHRVQIAVTM